MFQLPIVLASSSCLIFLPQAQRVYDAPRAWEPITIDGILGESAWATAPWTEEFVDILGHEAPVPPFRTRAKILWDDEHLYIGAEMEEPHLWATLQDRDAIIYQDDDFEVFLDPDGDGLAYFEIEINAMGTVFDLFMNKPYNQGGRAEIGWDAAGLVTGVSLMGTLNDPTDHDRGWTVEMAIPWSSLIPPGHDDHVLPPNLGDSWRVNFSSVDWPLEVVDGAYRKTETPTRENPHPESNWVWSPQFAVNMHLPEMWGVVRFREF
ncbi:MAG: carbohydrate-binding family 9-like protein [Gemmatimonadota bacterium]